MTTTTTAGPPEDHRLGPSSSQHHMVPDQAGSAANASNKSATKSQAIRYSLATMYAIRDTALTFSEPTPGLYSLLQNHFAPNTAAAAASSAGNAYGSNAVSTRWAPGSSRTRQDQFTQQSGANKAASANTARQHRYGSFPNGIGSGRASEVADSSTAGAVTSNPSTTSTMANSSNAASALPPTTATAAVSVPADAFNANGRQSLLGQPKLGPPTALPLVPPSPQAEEPPPPAARIPSQTDQILSQQQSQQQFMIDGPPPGWTVPESSFSRMTDQWRNSDSVGGGGGGSKTPIGAYLGHTYQQQPRSGYLNWPVMNQQQTYSEAQDDLWDSPIQNDECTKIFTLGDIREAEQRIEQSGIPPEVFTDTVTQHLLHGNVNGQILDPYLGYGRDPQPPMAYDNIFFLENNNQQCPVGESRFTSLFGETRQQQRRKQQMQHQQRLQNEIISTEMPRPSIPPAESNGNMRSNLIRLLANMNQPRAEAPIPEPRSGLPPFPLNPAAPNFSPSGIYHPQNTISPRADYQPRAQAAYNMRPWQQDPPPPRGVQPAPPQSQVPSQDVPPVISRLMQEGNQSSHASGIDQLLHKLAQQRQQEKLAQQQQQEHQSTASLSGISPDQLVQLVQLLNKSNTSGEQARSELLQIAAQKIRNYQQAQQESILAQHQHATLLQKQQQAMGPPRQAVGLEDNQEKLRRLMGQHHVAASPSLMQQQQQHQQQQHQQQQQQQQQQTNQANLMRQRQLLLQLLQSLQKYKQQNSNQQARQAISLATALEEITRNNGGGNERQQHVSAALAAVVNRLKNRQQQQQQQQRVDGGIGSSNETGTSSVNNNNTANGSSGETEDGLLVPQAQSNGD